MRSVVHSRESVPGWLAAAWTGPLLLGRPGPWVSALVASATATCTSHSASTYLILAEPAGATHTGSACASFRCTVTHTYWSRISFFHGSGSTCLSACGWSNTSVLRGPHYRMPLPAQSSSYCRIPAACPRELVIFPACTRRGPPWPPAHLVPASSSSLMSERSMTETISQLLFFLSPSVLCSTTGYPCTLRGRFLFQPARRRAKPPLACVHRDPVTSDHR